MKKSMDHHNEDACIFGLSSQCPRSVQVILRAFLLLAVKASEACAIGASVVLNNFHTEMQICCPRDQTDGILTPSVSADGHCR